MASELDKELSTIRHIIYLCWGADCKRKGAKPLAKRIEQFLQEKQLEDQVLLIRTKCVGQCEHAPLMCIQPDLAWYGPVDKTTVTEILESHLRQNGNGKNLEQQQISVEVAQPQLTKKRKH